MMEAPVRIVANENVSGTVIRELRARGHDVLSVKESLRGEGDETILARAQAELRIVVTHDKDFGALAFQFGLPAQCGVILLRLPGTDRDGDNRRILKVLESHSEWEGRFSVVEQQRVRARPLRGKATDESGSNG